MRILVVEDDSAVSVTLTQALERERHSVCVSETGREGVALARTWGPDVVLLDVQLPDMDGLDVVRRIRTFSTVPVIMVTGMGEVEQRIKGLEAGANDYVVKPYNSLELLARIRAVTRTVTPGSTPSSVVTVGDVVIDVIGGSVTKGGEAIELSAKEFEILRLLAGRPGQIVRHDEISRAVWGASPAQVAGTLHVHLSWIRKKLGDDADEPRYIETVRGVGVRLRNEE